MGIQVNVQGMISTNYEVPSFDRIIIYNGGINQINEASLFFYAKQLYDIQSLIQAIENFWRTNPQSTTNMFLHCQSSSPAENQSNLEKPYFGLVNIDIDYSQMLHDGITDISQNAKKIIISSNINLFEDVKHILPKIDDRWFSNEYIEQSLGAKPEYRCQDLADVLHRYGLLPKNPNAKYYLQNSGLITFGGSNIDQQMLQNDFPLNNILPLQTLIDQSGEGSTDETLKLPLNNNEATRPNVDRARAVNHRSNLRPHRSRTHYRAYPNTYNFSGKIEDLDYDSKLLDYRHLDWTTLEVAHERALHNFALGETEDERIFILSHNYIGFLTIINENEAVGTQLIKSMEIPSDEIISAKIHELQYLLNFAHYLDTREMINLNEYGTVLMDDIDENEVFDYYEDGKIDAEGLYLFILTFTEGLLDFIKQDQYLNCTNLLDHMQEGQVLMLMQQAHKAYYGYNSPRIWDRIDDLMDFYQESDVFKISGSIHEQSNPIVFELFNNQFYYPYLNSYMFDSFKEYHFFSFDGRIDSLHLDSMLTNLRTGVSLKVANLFDPTQGNNEFDQIWLITHDFEGTMPTNTINPEYIDILSYYAEHNLLMNKRYIHRSIQKTGESKIKDKSDITRSIDYAYQELLRQIIIFTDERKYLAVLSFYKRNQEFIAGLSKRHQTRLKYILSFIYQQLQDKENYYKTIQEVLSYFEQISLEDKEYLIERRSRRTIMEGLIFWDGLFNDLDLSFVYFDLSGVAQFLKWTLKYPNPLDEAVYWSTKSLKLRIKNNFIRDILVGLNDLATIYSNQRDLDSARSLLNQRIKLANRSGFQRMEINGLYNNAVVHFRQKENTKSMALILKARQFFDQHRINDPILAFRLIEQQLKLQLKDNTITSNKTLFELNNELYELVKRNSLRIDYQMQSLFLRALVIFKVPKIDQNSVQKLYSVINELHGQINPSSTEDLIIEETKQLFIYLVETLILLRSNKELDLSQLTKGLSFVISGNLHHPSTQSLVIELFILAYVQNYKTGLISDYQLIDEKLLHNARLVAKTLMDTEDYILLGLIQFLHGLKFDKSDKIDTLRKTLNGEISSYAIIFDINGYSSFDINQMDEEEILLHLEKRVRKYFQTDGYLTVTVDQGLLTGMQILINDKSVASPKDLIDLMESTQRSFTN